jgi:hypothetical protein
MSIVRPLGEGGKLQLTTDMTELEFALSAFVVDPAHPRKTGGGMQALGDEYLLLRAMRFVDYLYRVYEEACSHRVFAIDRCCFLTIRLWLDLSKQQVYPHS